MQKMVLNLSHLCETKLSHQCQLSEFEELIMKNLLRNYLCLF